MQANGIDSSMPFNVPLSMGGAISAWFLCRAMRLQLLAHPEKRMNATGAMLVVL